MSRTDESPVAPAFELANVGPGPDPCSLSALADEHDVVLALFQRDHRCIKCREQVQAVADRYGVFAQRGAEVVSIVPEPRETVRSWQDSYDLPYPLLADPGATVGDAYDQPVRFGIFGDLSDFLGRMPEAVVIDCRTDTPRIAWSHAGNSTFDRPEVQQLLAAVDDVLAG